jgi:hypothetical protein
MLSHKINKIRPAIKPVNPKKALKTPQNAPFWPFFACFCLKMTIQISEDLAHLEAIFMTKVRAQACNPNPHCLLWYYRYAFLLTS